jgi:hypothetical protein
VDRIRRARTHILEIVVSQKCTADLARGEHLVQNWVPTDTEPRAAVVQLAARHGEGGGIGLGEDFDLVRQGRAHVRAQLLVELEQWLRLCVLGLQCKGNKIRMAVLEFRLGIMCV